MPAAPITLWERQSLGADVGNFEGTFSSWDSCMAKDYCKYPVIVAIVIASLILLSIISCIVRCCCCGMECCCACCSCFNRCCPSPRGKNRTKYADSPYPPPAPYQGYQPNPPPFYGQPPAPQFATFDASSKVHADSLPAMPSWDTASSRKVLEEVHPEEVEMDHMGPSDEAAAPMLAHQAPTYGGHNENSFVEGSAAPTPYQDRIQQGADQGYYGAGAGAGAASPYGGQHGYNNNGQTQYGVVPSAYSSTTSPRPQQSAYGQGGYRGVSPTGGAAAAGGGMPSALQPAAMASRPGQQQGGYQSYAPQSQQTAYSAYTPSTESSTVYEPSYSGHSATTTLPAQRRPMPQQGSSQSWRDI